MQGRRPTPRAAVAGRVELDAAVAALLRNSLVAYVAVELLTRTWTVLNMDLLQLLKRL